MFPKDYPQAAYPGGTPTVELERNPLISLKDRAFMLRRLRIIRETRRPCLEACLKFLLFGNDGDKGGSRRNPGSSSSDEDEDSRVDTTTSAKNETAPYLLLRNDKNLAEPRTSQGVFGPNGKLYAVLTHISC
jgi:WD repeat-containing protein 59